MKTLVRHLGCIVLVAVSCRNSTAPVDSKGKGTRLAALSSTRIGGRVGTPVEDIPAVVVRDRSGGTVAGVAVIFTVRSGGGSITNPRVFSSSAGIARLAGWTMGNAPGVNVIAATNASGDTIVFTADAVAGPPFYLRKIDGDEQIGLPGAALHVHPRVTVSDRYNNRLSGGAVTFAVEAGGGSVSPTLAVTDSSGVAESGDWVLGQPGVQRLVARTGEIGAEPFTARAVDLPPGCGAPSQLPLGTAIASALTTRSCKGPDGRYLDVYTIEVTAPTGHTFFVASTDFDTSLELRGPDLSEVARNDDRDWATTNSKIKALLLPGTYMLFVSSSKAGATGAYGLSHSPASMEAERCEDTFITRGFESHGVVYFNDCALESNLYADRFRIYLDAGSRVEIVVDDYSYAGPNVELNGPGDSHAFATSGGNYLTTLIYVARVSGYYTVSVGLLNESVEYDITVR